MGNGPNAFHGGNLLCACAYRAIAHSARADLGLYARNLSAAKVRRREVRITSQGMAWTPIQIAACIAGWAVIELASLWLLWDVLIWEFRLLKQVLTWPGF